MGLILQPARPDWILVVGEENTTVALSQDVCGGVTKSLQLPQSYTVHIYPEMLL
jgi:hypothetical protein